MPLVFRLYIFVLLEVESAGGLSTVTRGYTSRSSEETTFEIDSVLRTADWSNTTVSNSADSGQSLPQRAADHRSQWADSSANQLVLPAAGEYFN